MRLYIGAQGAGKLKAACRDRGREEIIIKKGESGEWEGKVDIFDGLHLFIKIRMEKEDQYEEILEKIQKMISENPEIFILCDEIGCGVVPVDRFEREWREITGRVLCELTAQARQVNRVFYGIVQKIKGEVEE